MIVPFNVVCMRVSFYGAPFLSFLGLRGVAMLFFSFSPVFGKQKFDNCMLDAKISMNRKRHSSKKPLSPLPF